MCVPTSSMGRLFDAVSSLLGVRQSPPTRPRPPSSSSGSPTAASGRRPADYRFDARAAARSIPRRCWAAMVDDLRQGCPTGAMAAGFHVAVARLIAERPSCCTRRPGIDRVALSGGVFQNVLLLRLARAELTAAACRVLTHRLVPPNDGGSGTRAGRRRPAGADRARAGGMMAVDGAPTAHARGRRGPAEDLAAAALTLARRFAAGATMWCVSPSGRPTVATWPWSSSTRSSSARGPSRRSASRVATSVDAVRLLARPGDVLLAVSSADDPATRRPVSPGRSLGADPALAGCRAAGPSPGRAEHVVWLDGDDPALASRSGDMVLLYHLLWELTHVVFEHPGLLDAPRPDVHR